MWFKTTRLIWKSFHKSAINALFKSSEKSHASTKATYNNETIVIRTHAHTKCIYPFGHKSLVKMCDCGPQRAIYCLQEKARAQLMWLSHTQKLFFPHSCACQHLHCPYFFGAKCFHFGLLWCAEMINMLMTLRLPEENKNYRPEDTGNVTHHSVLLGDKLHTFSYAPTNIWQYFKALHKASRMNTWYVCLFVF